MIAIGAVMGSHGVRGALRVKLHNPESQLLFEIAEVLLHGPEPDSERRYEIADARPASKGFLVTLSGIESLEAAQALRGAELRVPRSALPELEPGEFYHCDLEGLSAVDGEGRTLGRIERVLSYPAADVLQIATERGMLELPMHEPYLVRVDLAAGHVMVDQLDDLEPDPAGRPRRGPAEG